MSDVGLCPISSGLCQQDKEAVMPAVQHHFLGPPSLKKLAAAPSCLFGGACSWPCWEEATLLSREAWSDRTQQLASLPAV